MMGDAPNQILKAVSGLNGENVSKSRQPQFLWPIAKCYLPIAVSWALQKLLPFTE
jgi:hypothetical protein